MLAEILIVLALVLANGVFAGAEIAIVAQRKTRVLELVAEGRGGAKALLELRETPERFLATVQIGITVVGASAAAFSGAAIAERLAVALARIEGLAAYADEIAFGTVVALVSFLSIVLGELVPKSLALRAGERYALAIARPLQLLSWVARPVVRLLTGASNLVLRPFGDRTTFTEARHSVSEVVQIVGEAMQAGTVHATAGEIATRALELPELTAMDVMVPRADVVMLPRHATTSEVRDVLKEHRYSRLPVYDGTMEEIVGYVSLKDIVVPALENEQIVLDTILRPPFFVPETQRALDVLHDMRTRRVPFGIVVDEQGGVAGILTIEDLLEELVGDIYSEHADAGTQPIQREASGAVIVAANMPVRELNRELALELPENGDWTTVGGLCTSLAGRIPAPGTVLDLSDGVQLEVVDASPRRVRTVRVRTRGANSRASPTSP